MTGLIGFAAGAVFGAGQVFFARKAIFGSGKPGFVALYISQLLILSFGLLTAVFFLWRQALVPVAVGIVASSVVLAVAFSLKR